MSRAWVRDVSDTFDRAITERRAPDVPLARRQHQDYVSRLETSGLEVIHVASDVAHPDCVFIEDTAVLLGSLLLSTMPGAAERRGEVAAVIAEISPGFDTREMELPAVLDGGDVMVMGDVVYVGRSERTNEPGLEFLTEVAAEVGLKTVPVDVTGVLHLKSAVLPIGPETVVVTPRTVDESSLDDLRIVHENESERHQFSALPLPDRVLVTSSAPVTTATLEELGFGVDPINVSEILAADGGLTCMSIVEPWPA